MVDRKKEGLANRQVEEITKDKWEKVLEKDKVLQEIKLKK